MHPLSTPESDAPTARSDADLIDAVRSGSSDSFAELWKRHSGAATAYARTFSRIAAPDDLVAEPFTRILAILRAGKGPTTSFRPYLISVVRNTAMSIAAKGNHEQSTDDFTTYEGAPSAEDVTVGGAERSLATRAFRSLPSRWQAALWYSEVEKFSRQQIAELLSIKPNAVSALTFRARDALRTAWIQAHIDERALPPECRPTVDLLGGHVRHTLSQRDQRRVDDHLDECNRCRQVVAELTPLSASFPSLAVLVLGGVAGGVSILALGSPDVAMASEVDPTSQIHQASGPVRTVAVSILGGGAAVAILVAAAFAMASVWSPGWNGPSVTATGSDRPAALAPPERQVDPSPIHDPVPPVEPPITDSVAPNIEPKAPPPSPDAPTDVAPPLESVAPDAPSRAAETPASLAPPIVTFASIDHAGWLLPELSGTALPFATVTVRADGNQIHQVQADSEGQWMVAPLSVEPGDWKLELEQTISGMTSIPFLIDNITQRMPSFHVDRPNPAQIVIIVQRPAPYDVLFGCNGLPPTLVSDPGQGELTFECDIVDPEMPVTVQFQDPATSRLTTTGSAEVPLTVASSSSEEVIPVSSSEDAPSDE